MKTRKRISNLTILVLSILITLSLSSCAIFNFAVITEQMLSDAKSYAAKIVEYEKLSKALEGIDLEAKSKELYEFGESLRQKYSLDHKIFTKFEKLVKAEVNKLIAAQNANAAAAAAAEDTEKEE